MIKYNQIIECEDRLLEAMKTGDIKILDELIHDNLIFNIPTGQTITKAIDLDNYRSGMLIINEIVATDQIIQSFDDTYIVAVTIQLKAKYATQNIDGQFRYLRVWKLIENSWKIIAGSGFQIH